MKEGLINLKLIATLNAYTKILLKIISKALCKLLNFLSVFNVLIIVYEYKKQNVYEVIITKLQRIFAT